MEHAVVFAGFGGQGLLFAGQILARAAIADGLETFWIPSYGPEMRGGTAACTVIVGDEEIGSPVVDRYDAAVVMNPPSLAKFGPRVAERGLLIINTSLVEAGADRPQIDELRLPCTELAASAGDDKLVSVVALGALIGAPRLGLARVGHRSHSRGGGRQAPVDPRSGPCGLRRRPPRRCGAGRRLAARRARLEAEVRLHHHQEGDHRRSARSAACRRAAPCGRLHQGRRRAARRGARPAAGAAPSGQRDDPAHGRHLDRQRVGQSDQVEDDPGQQPVRSRSKGLIATDQIRPMPVTGMSAPPGSRAGSGSPRRRGSRNCRASGPRRPSPRITEKLKVGPKAMIAPSTWRTRNQGRDRACSPHGVRPGRTSASLSAAISSVTPSHDPPGLGREHGSGRPDADARERDRIGSRRFAVR